MAPKWGWTEKVVFKWGCEKECIPNLEFSLRLETKGFVTDFGFCELTPYIKILKGDQIAVSLQQGK